MHKNNHRNHPIGVFDSGIGGLTVVKELMSQLPHEDVVYFGDTARVPYGTKSKESVIRFTKECVSVLLEHNVKMVVVACNTASSHALETLKKIFRVPIIGVIQPGARKAVGITRNKRIGVIATQSTINSGSYVKQIKHFNHAAKVVTQPCPLFVPFAEEGWFDKKVTFDVAREYLTPVKKFHSDTVILGCTHYPLLKSVIQKVLGSKVTLVDSAREVAGEVKALLQKEDLMRQNHRPARHLFLVSDEPEHFRKLARRFLQNEIHNVKRAVVG